MKTLVDVLLATERYLRDKGVSSPRLEAELLLGHTLSLNRVQLYLSHDRPMTEDDLDRLRPLVARRGKREPMAWILGHQPFHNIDLLVGPGVLVPRPDTETLVEAALEWLPKTDDAVYVADIGCGSGAVGLAIAHERPNVRLFAVDKMHEPLVYTRRNRDALALAGRVAVLEGDLLNAIPTTRDIDWVVSNPPYVRASEIDDLMPEVSKWEPREALDGGADGLDLVRRIARQAESRVRRGVLFEIGMGQAGRTAEILREHGFSDVAFWKDLAGIERVVGGRRSLA